MTTRHFEPSPEFQAAQARWNEFTKRRRALNEKYEGAQAAMALLRNPSSSRGQQISPIVAEKAAAYRGDRVLDVELLHLEMRELEVERGELGKIHAVEQCHWNAARQAESERQAELLRPARKEAGDRLVAAVHELSEAIEADRAICNELRSFGLSCNDTGYEFGTLSEYHSLLSQWLRRMAVEGLVDAHV